MRGEIDVSQGKETTGKAEELSKNPFLEVRE
jgi:hypothetical protein